MPGASRPSTPTVTWTGVCIDCADAADSAEFYQRVFGWEIAARDGNDWFQLRDPNGGVGLNLQTEPGYEPPTWPDMPGQRSKMMHMEVLVDDLEAAVSLVVEAGGQQAAHQPPDRDQAGLRIMLDPSGHPFCLFVAGE